MFKMLEVTYIPVMMDEFLTLPLASNLGGGGGGGGGEIAELFQVI